MAKRGPKEIQIDPTQFEKLCMLQATLFEIASFFQCSEDTVENWCKKTYFKKFSDIYKEKRGLGKISLRRMQWQTAEKGNVTMQIWLGKQVLGQTDKQEVEHTMVKPTVIKRIGKDEYVELGLGKTAELPEPETIEVERKKK